MTNPRFAISNQVFAGWDSARAIDYIAGLGFQGIEIAPPVLADSIRDITVGERTRIRRAAEKAGIQIVGFHSVLKSPSEQLHISHPDPAVRGATVDYMHAAIDLASDLAAGIIVIGSPQQRNVPSGLTYAQAWDNAVATCSALLAHATQAGVTLCIEPIAPTITDFITTVDEGLRLVEQIAHPRCQLMIDVRAACSEQRPIPELIHKAAPHLVHFHANDDDGRYPGRGHADYWGIALALREIDYQGWLSVEVFQFDESPEEIASRSLAALQRYFNTRLEETA